MSKSDGIARLDAVAQAELVRRGEVSATELVEAAAERLRVMNPLIHAVVTTDVERARARAAERPSGPLGGVPFLFKDLIAYPGMRWSLGARLMAGNVAPAGSPYTDACDAAGLVTLGKTATSELGLLGSTETLLEGVTHNPWDLSRSAAGSSGGAAAAVAAGIVPLAHASDGGGSVRIPAAVCGLFGLKPSRGRCLPSGPASPPLGDLVADGPISRTVRDAATFLSITEVTGDGAAFPPVGLVRGPSKKKLRIAAVSRTLMGHEPDAEPRAALDGAMALCAKLGHDVEPVRPPELDGAAVSWAFFTGAGAVVAGMSMMMGQMLGRQIGWDDLERFTLEVGAEFVRQGPASLGKVSEVIAKLSSDYLRIFEKFDVVLTPTLATETWALGHLSGVLSREEALRRTERAVGYTPIHNMAGCPAMSVPLHWSRAGLPVGTNYAARPGAEATLLELAYQLEDAAPWRDRWAPWSYPVVKGV
ncbi:amidase [Myxococcota bacterium]|nr:amidase [Myxococcota bacterium]